VRLGVRADDDFLGAPAVVYVDGVDEVDAQVADRGELTLAA
jgi:hypothetical protein